MCLPLLGLKVEGCSNCILPCCMCNLWLQLAASGATVALAVWLLGLWPDTAAPTHTVFGTALACIVMQVRRVACDLRLLPTQGQPGSELAADLIACQCIVMQGGMLVGKPRRWLGQTVVTTTTHRSTITRIPSSSPYLPVPFRVANVQLPPSVMSMCSTSR